MIAKNKDFDKYQTFMSISFSLLYYANAALSLYVTESSHDYTGFFTVFFILYAIDKLMTFVIAKAWQHKQGFFTWLLDCFNLGFIAIIYYSRKNSNNFKNIYRLKLFVAIIPMTILQIVYFFNQRLIYQHILEDQSIAISQIGVTIFIINIIFIAYTFTKYMQKPNIFVQDHINNLISESFKKFMSLLAYNTIHFISYFGLWALLAQQKFYFYNKICLAIVAVTPILFLTLIETIITKGPIPLLNVFFNHPQLNQKALKDSLQCMKESRIRSVLCFIHLLLMMLISIFLSEGNPFEAQTYNQDKSENEVERNFIDLIQKEIFRFEMFVYALSLICLLLNLRDLKEALTCYWIEEESTSSLTTIINKLIKNPSLKYVYINTQRRGSRSSSLNQPLIFDDEETQTRGSYSDSTVSESEEIFNLKTSFLNRLVQIQSEGGILCINKTILVKPNSFMIDKDIFNKEYMVSYLQQVQQLPLSISYKIEKSQLNEIVKNRLLKFGIEMQQNVINLITNNEKYRNDSCLKFTKNYFSSNIHSSIAFNKILSPLLINLPAQILYDLHEI